MLALLFPGQGSHEVGMGRDAFEASLAAREVFETADATLGFPLSRLCFEGPKEELVRTEIQQPAILATSVALLRGLEERTKLSPACVAGHSLGEYSALVAAGALGFEDAVRLVHARGRFMQEAVPEAAGGMAAVMGMAPADVARTCREAAAQTGGVVAPANLNGPRQVVISGDTESVELACSFARREGAKRTVKLDVSAPFHCRLMAPAAEKLAVELSRLRFHDARVPVVSNVDAQPCRSKTGFRELLEQQVTAPVRFDETVNWMAESGVTRVIEIGPGHVLTGLVGRIARDLKRANLSSLADLDEAVEFVSTG